MDKNEVIFELYKEGKSDTFIAKQLGYKSGESIRQWRLKRGLKSHGYTSNYVFDRVIAEEMYLSGKTYTEIAETLNVKPITLNCYFLKKYGKLPSEKRQSAAIELTQVQKEVLFGSLLGDANLRIANNGINPSGQIEHCARQKDYLEYKRNFLSTLCSKINENKRFDRRFKQQEYFSYSFRIKSNPCLHEFYNMFYKNGKKILPEDLSLLNPLALAIWFMDDGSRCDNTYKLATQSFSEEENARLCEYLYNRYSLELTHYKTSNILYIRANSSKLFTYLIQDYICDNMKYKIVS